MATPKRTKCTAVVRANEYTVDIYLRGEDPGWADSAVEFLGTIMGYRPAKGEYFTVTVERRQGRHKV